MIRNDFLQRYKNANEAMDDLRNQPKKDRGKSPSSLKSLQLGKTKVGAGNGNGAAKTALPQFNNSKNLLIIAAVLLSSILLFLAPKIWGALQALKYYRQGNTLIESGEYEEAIDSFDLALANREDFPQALNK